LVSPATRFEASELTATKRPSALGKPPKMLEASPSAPALATLARTVCPGHLGELATTNTISVAELELTPSLTVNVKGS
jgi:hypothetical protein